jgi:hypothetical protein
VLGDPRASQGAGQRPPTRFTKASQSFRRRKPRGRDAVSLAGLEHVENARSRKEMCHEEDRNFRCLRSGPARAYRDGVSRSDERGQPADRSPEIANRAGILPPTTGTTAGIAAGTMGGIGTDTIIGTMAGIRVPQPWVRRWGWRRFRSRWQAAGHTMATTAILLVKASLLAV